MNKRILVVDDAPDFGRLLGKVLPGYNFRQALTAAEALALALFWRPHLFILDVRLGDDICGIELGRILASDSVYQGIPIIYVSASIELPDLSDEPGWLNGCPAFGKPFKLDALRRCVRAALGEEDEAVIPPSRPAERGTTGLSLFQARSGDAPAN